MKLAIVLTLGFLTLAPQAFANVANDAPLAPGKPAGVHTAQFERGTGIYIVAGAALIGITAALVSASNNQSAASGTNPGGGGSTTTSTSTTSP